MSNASERAEFLRAQRPIRNWVRRFRKLAEQMPPEVWVYVASGSVHVMACDEKGRPYEKEHGDGTSQDGIVESVRGGHWDGGDW